MTIKEALMNSVSFSVSAKQAEMIAISRGLDLGSTFDMAASNSREFLLCKADLIRLIVTMPNVSEGGVSISFSDKKTMLGIANSIYSRFGEEQIKETRPTVRFVEDW